MAKIIYGVAGEGRGHSSRSRTKSQDINILAFCFKYQ
ncbi:MAG: glycosyltransferase family protein [Patescibacteria group bacterium]